MEKLKKELEEDDLKHKQIIQNLKEEQKLKKMEYQKEIQKEE